MRASNASMGSRAGAVLADPGQWALFLDIDGTLLGMAPTPDAVHVPAGLVDLIERAVRRMDGAAAILTGRRIADADRLLDPLRLVASGVHGTELRRQCGGSIAELARPIPTDVIQAMNKISALASGIMVEQKGSGVAVHYRNAPLARQALETEMAAIIAASDYDLVLRQGRKVIEAVPGGFSKGTAMLEIVGAPPFEGRRPVMIGDDVGDESAFAVAERLGGLGLRVAGEHYGREQADFAGVAAVRAFLHALADGDAASHHPAATA